MIIYFWIAMVVFLVFACSFFVPWLQSWWLSVTLVCMVGLSSFTLYICWGSSHYLPHYYSAPEITYRQKQSEIQALLTEFRKAELSHMIDAQ